MMAAARAGCRTAYKVTTSSGTVGWGESRGGPPPPGSYAHLIGRSLAESVHFAALRALRAASRSSSSCVALCEDLGYFFDEQS